jgi:transcriptional regulator with XRE-family HTH domain
METEALIRAARRRAGLTQAQLAHRAGTSQPVVSAYEHGRRDPGVGTLTRLIAATGERLEISSVARPNSDLEPPRDLDEHASRLLDVLSVADAFPGRARPPLLHAPRLVSR